MQPSPAPFSDEALAERQRLIAQSDRLERLTAAVSSYKLLVRELRHDMLAALDWLDIESPNGARDILLKALNRPTPKL